MHIAKSIPIQNLIHFILIFWIPWVGLRISWHNFFEARGCAGYSEYPAQPRASKKLCQPESVNATKALLTMMIWMPYKLWSSKLTQTVRFLLTPTVRWRPPLLDTQLKYIAINWMAMFSIVCPLLIKRPMGEDLTVGAKRNLTRVLWCNAPQKCRRFVDVVETYHDDIMVGLYHHQLLIWPRLIHKTSPQLRKKPRARCCRWGHYRDPTTHFCTRLSQLLQGNPLSRKLSRSPLSSQSSSPHLASY